LERSRRLNDVGPGARPQRDDTQNRRRSGEGCPWGSGGCCSGVGWRDHNGAGLNGRGFRDSNGRGGAGGWG
jgi:hypothetical protein